ncbi:hypothetical protein B7K05_04345 [Campylobacter coli]|nr:hypothetical protein [Campylobacter coli]
MITIENELLKYICKQLDFFYIDNDEKLELSDILSALEKVNFCFSRISAKYYEKNFCLKDVHHTSKYTMFLYYLSNIVFKKNKLTLASQIYALNKMLHGIDMYYEIELPSVFMLEHPVGTVLGRAKYPDYFCVYQNCTVGGVRKNNKIYYPEFENSMGLKQNKKKGGGVSCIVM